MRQLFISLFIFMAVRSFALPPTANTSQFGTNSPLSIKPGSVQTNPVIAGTGLFDTNGIWRVRISGNVSGFNWTNQQSAFSANEGTGLAQILWTNGSAMFRGGVDFSGLFYPASGLPAVVATNSSLGVSIYYTNGVTALQAHPAGVRLRGTNQATQFGLDATGNFLKEPTGNYSGLLIRTNSLDIYDPTNGTLVASASNGVFNANGGGITNLQQTVITIATTNSLLSAQQNATYLCDGSNDWVQWTNAALQGRFVIVASGTYHLTNTVQLSPGTAFQGNDMATTVIDVANNTSQVFTFLSANGALRNLTITGTTNAVAQTYINVSVGTGALLENITITNNNHGIIVGPGSMRPTFRNIYYVNLHGTDTFAQCLTVASNCYNVTVTGMYATNCDNAIVVGQGCQNVHFLNGSLKRIQRLSGTSDANVCAVQQSSGDSWGMTNVSFQNFYIEDSDPAFIFLANQTGSTPIENIIVRNCQISGGHYPNGANGHAQFEIYNCRNTLFDGVKSTEGWVEIGQGALNTTFRDCIYKRLIIGATNVSQPFQVESVSGSPSTNTLFSHCYYEDNNTNAGSYLMRALVSGGTGLYGLTFDLCTFNTITNAGGLEIQSSVSPTNCVVSRNRFNKGTGTGNYAADDSSGATIEDNTVTGDYSFAAVVLRGNNAKVRRNNFVGLSSSNNGFAWVRAGVVGCIIEGNTGQQFWTDASAIAGANTFRLNGTNNTFNTLVIFTNGVSSSSTIRTPVAVTVGASPFSFTNGTGVNLECYFSGGTAYAVAKNGAGVFGSLAGDCYFALQPSNICVITYTVAPTMFTNSW